MNNGHGPGGAQVDQMLAQAAAQSAAEAQLKQALDHSLRNPMILHRFGASITGVAQEGPNRVLLIALPTGERFDVPMPRAAAINLARQLMAGIPDESAQ